MRRFLYLLLVVMGVALGVRAQPAGFDEEIYPKIFLVHGNVKQVFGRGYSPQGFADTLGNGVVEDTGRLYFDRLGRLIKRVGNEVKYRTGPDEVDIYTYFGTDSVIKRGGDRRYAANEFKTVNRYDVQRRLIAQEFYHNPRKLSAKVINTYDRNGYLVQQVHKGEADQKDIITTYVNDSRGNHLEILPPSVNGGMNTKRTLTYNDHNDVTSIADYPYASGSFRFFYYEYDGHGNWVKMTEYSGDPKCHAAHVIFREISYYND